MKYLNNYINLIIEKNSFQIIFIDFKLIKWNYLFRILIVTTSQIQVSEE